MIALLHFLAALHFWFSCYYDWNYVEIPIEIHRMGRSFGRTNKLKFLTFWDAILQAVFFTVCFLNDITNKDRGKIKSTKLGKLQDLLMTCLAFPLSMFVGLTFWGLYLVDRELVLPKAVDAFFPQWLNHCMHTNIMVFILIEMFTAERQYPKRQFGLKVLTSFMLLYLVWVHIIFAYTGFWVYPVLDVLNLPLRLFFFGSLLGLSVLLYIVGEKLDNTIWGKTSASSTSSVQGRSSISNKRK